MAGTRGWALGGRVRAFGLSGVALSALFASGCPGTSEGPTDAGVGEIDGSSALDGGGVHDAGPEGSVDAALVACSVSSVPDSLACGDLCARSTRTCAASGFWEYGACLTDPTAVCTPGETGTTRCGRCGTIEAICDPSCHFSPTGTCVGETGSCVPGTSMRTSTGCGAGETQVLHCDDTCEWRTTECVARPTDFDGDGAPYGTDCDDADADVVLGVSEACGTFYCPDAGGALVATPGVRTCVGPGWTECARPATCPEPTGVCTPAGGGPMEVRTCETMTCARREQRRTCAGLPDGTYEWGAWTACAVVSTATPAGCVPPAEETCGACGEGVRYVFCGAECARTRTDCLGAGCAPNASRREASDCPAGEVRTSVCGVDCLWGTPSACAPGRPSGTSYMISSIVADCRALDANAEVLSTLSGDDVMSGPRPLPFPFELFGDPVFEYLVSTNGFVALQRVALPFSPYVNAPIPTNDVPNGLVAALWDDLTPIAPDGSHGQIASQVLVSGGERRFVVEWRDFGFPGSPGTLLTMQAHLVADTNVVELHYCSLAGPDVDRVTGGQATIGLESLDGTYGAAHSFDRPMAVASGTGLRFTPMP